MAHLISADLPAGEPQVLGSQTVIGRYSFCDVVLRDKNISRQHARISHTNGHYFIEDLNSLNGTFVNDQRVQERTQLYDRDRIRLHERSWVFHDPQSPARIAEKGALRPTSTVAAASAAVPHDSQVVSAVIPPTDTGAREKLHAVLQMTRSLSGSLDDEDDVLANILEGVFALFRDADRGSILMADKDGNLTVHAFRQADDPTNSDELTPASWALASRVLRTQDAVLSTDIPEDESDSESVFAAPRRSILCAPLLRPHRQPLGVIHVESSGTDASFDEEDLEVLLSMAAIGAQAVEFARAHKAQMALDRQKQELAMAHQVQMHFLPQKCPTLSGYDFFQFYASAYEVGGDYFGYVPLDDRRLAIAVGDVSGKGISAALMMARLCAEVPYSLATTESVHEAMERLSREMLDPTADHHFITFVLGVLDAEQHQIMLANAGHPAPLRRRARDGGVEFAGQGGLPLGVGPVRAYEQFPVDLEPGDTLLFFTDGITEAMDENEDFYGLPRLQEFVERSSLHGTSLGRAVLADVQRFSRDSPQSDDICLVCVQRLPE